MGTHSLATTAAGLGQRWFRRALDLGARLVLGVLLASTGWLAAQPRADQPLLDAMEAYWPALRETYFSPQEKTIYADAEHYVKRYSAEMERLTQMEARSRWQGAALDDDLLRKISSFQQSYNEMIKGERFVMREIRARARERLRWPLLAGTVALYVLAWALARRRHGAPPNLTPA